MRKRGRPGTRAAVIVLVCTVTIGMATIGMATIGTVTIGAGPAAAAPRPAVAPYWGSFVIDGDPATGLSGALTMPGGFPGFGLIESTSNELAAAGDGASAFLNAATPVGQVFGSSIHQPLLTAGAAPDGGSSATSYRLGDGTPTSDWAFVLGDIDADQVNVVGRTTQDGDLVPPAALGFQGTFNYCTGDPLPPACGGQSSSDAPTWDPATGILTGHGSDTNGASAWFAPTVPLTSLSFQFTADTPDQTFQTWFVSDTRTLSGTVTADGGAAIGGAQLDLGILPVGGVDSTTSAPDGTYRFGPLAPRTYQVDATSPTGYLPAGPTTRTADLLDGDATGVDFAVAAAIYRAGGSPREARVLPMSRSTATPPTNPASGRAAPTARVTTCVRCCRRATIRSSLSRNRDLCAFRTPPSSSPLSTRTYRVLISRWSRDTR
ncbi:MAG TPA: carboxypeptidase regulatory-like domain-containing protein [Nakamurella sp.]